MSYDYMIRSWPRAFLSLLSSAFVVLAATRVHAQVLPTGELPEVLKDLPRSGTICKRDDAGSGKFLGPDRVAWEVDLGCLRSHAQVREEWNPSNSILFDLRLRSKFERFHAEGAISTNEAELISKPYWRTKNIVLMGSGVDDFQLSMVCRRLKTNGYKHVVVLQGGVLSQIRDGVKMSGSPDSINEAVRLTVPEVWTLSRQPQVMVLADTDRSEFLKDIRHARPISEVNDLELKKLLKSYATGDKKISNGPVAVILLSSTELGEDALLRLQKTVSPAPLLVYTGAHSDYTRDIGKLNSVWKSHERGPKKAACVG